MSKICKHCGNEFDLDPKVFSNHVRWCDKNPKKDEYKSSNAKGIEAMNKARMSSGIANQYVKAKIENRTIVISEETRKKMSEAGKGRTHTEETRKLLSEKRKKFLKENPDKHPWKKNSKFKSIPCELLKNKLTQLGMNFDQEVCLVEDRYFSADIVLRDYNVVIEVNGNQHYNADGTLKDYYKERHELLTKNGWNVYELHYSVVYNEIQINQILDEIKLGENATISLPTFNKKEEKEFFVECNLCKKKFMVYEKEHLFPSKEKYFCSISCANTHYGPRRFYRAKATKITNHCKICGVIIKKYSTLCLACSRKESAINTKLRRVERPPYEQLMREIEETSYLAVGKKYGVSDTAIKKWIKWYEKNNK